MMPDFYVVFRLVVAGVSLLLAGMWLYDTIRAYRALPEIMKKRFWALRPSRFVGELTLLVILLGVLAFLIYLQWRLY